MILLAPRRIQEDFTSTETTRKLESHGLLDQEKPRTGSDRDRDRERARRHKEKQEKEVEKRRKAAESKTKSKGQTRDDSTLATSSSGSLASGSTLIPRPNPPPSSAPSLHTYPPSSTASINSTSSNEATFDRIISRDSSLARRRRRVRDPLDTSDDDDDDDDPRPTRTPHSEAYGTVDPSVAEEMRRVRERDSGTLLSRLFRSHNTPTAENRPAAGHAPAPWMLLQPRDKADETARAMNNLGKSFMGVGLVGTHHTKQKSKRIPSGTSNAVDIFQDIPPESFYMLLPLWPENTDPVSERKAPHYVKPVIPNEQRQYLLVYYKVALDASEDRKGGPEAKKRSRNSPTSSYDSQTKRDDPRGTTLLSTFHISARLVSYRDLQGSGVRIPDEGLSVAGPLEAAYSSMPISVREQGLFEFVLGVCNSREGGVEFQPDGLIKMGLCIQTSEVLEGPLSEEDEFPEPELELTPLGRAVMEMSWLGALAMTSFGPAGML